MANINELLARAAALRDETMLNSISPERAGGIMYDTLLAMNELWLQQGAALVISKIYASVAAMEADTAPVSDLTGLPLRPGQIVVIASSDSDNGSVYRYNGTSSPSWSLVGEIGNLEPVDSLDSDSTSLPLAARQGKVLDGKISQLGQEVGIQLKQQVPLENTLLPGGYINNSGTITQNANFSIKYAQVSKGDLVYISTAAGGGYGGFALFDEEPTLGSVPVTNINKKNIYYTVPFDCYIAVSGDNTAILSCYIYLFSYGIDAVIRRLADTQFEADAVYREIGKYKDAENSLPGYINSSGINAITGSPWDIKYVYVTKGTIIDSNGSVSGNFRAGFTNLEPSSGFMLDTIIPTDTTFPYVAERSGYFCISNSGTWYLRTKTKFYPAADSDDVSVISERLTPLATYEGYYIDSSGVWRSLQKQAVRVYAVTPGGHYYRKASEGNPYMFVGWCANLPSQGTVPDIVVPYSSGISDYQRAPATANYMLITGYKGDDSVDNIIYAYSADVPSKSRMLTSILDANTAASKNRSKKALYIGDSISTGYNWREYIKNDYGLDFEANNAAMPASVGGITLIPKQNETTDYESIWWRCAESRLLNAGYTPSIISIFGGTNDMASISMPIGTAVDLPFVDDSNDFTEQTIDASGVWPETITFCSALKGCILMMRRDFPDAEIIIPSVLYCGGSYGTWTPAGQTLIASEVIAKRQVEVAQTMGVRFVPWYWSERKESTIDAFSRDGVHPSVAGARVMARWFADYMPL